MDTPRPEPRGDGRKTYRPRLKGEARLRRAHGLADRYECGATVRELAASEDLAFGTVRTLLAEAGAVMRPRGDTRPYSPCSSYLS